MGIRVLVSAVLAALVLAVSAAPGAAPAVAQIPGQFTASDSYYHLDVENGRLTVRVEAEVQASGRELHEVWLWTLPGALDLTVERDGTALETTVVDEGGGEFELPTLISAKLPEPIRGAQRTSLTMTYEIGPGTGEMMSLEPGAIELLFVGQGFGSFILLDLPAHGDNYVDPGCVVAVNQPANVVDAGYERFVCGEATMAALSLDNPRVVRQCATLDDRCRQRVLPGPYNAYVQSITDPDKQGHIEAKVELSTGPVTLRLNYFRKDEEWAQSQFDIAQRSLPLVEEVFGFPYEFETLVMRQSHHIGLAGAAGIAFPTQGEVLLLSGSGIDEEVTIHELAHQWAGFNLEKRWMWEGLAEYATARVASQVGVSLYDRNWLDYPYDEFLSSWGYSSSITNPDYWYGRSEAFWHEYEAAVGGPEAVTAILALTDVDRSIHPVSERWFMDAGERHSGANLDQLFLDWVWNPQTATPVVESRRAAWDLLVPLRERAETLGMPGLPLDIESVLDAWQFSGITRLNDRANALLDEHEAIQALAAEAGLPPVNVLAGSWASSSMQVSADRLAAQRLAISTIVDAEVELAAYDAGLAAWEQIEGARSLYAEGDPTGAADRAARAVADVMTGSAAERMIEAAQNERDEFSPNLFTRVGMLFSDPDADLAAAEAALAAGDSERALVLSRSAFDAWDGAHGRGLQRLAMLMAAMAALTTGTWWLLGRASRGNEPPAGGSGGGHTLTRRESSWRDWSNS